MKPIFNWLDHRTGARGLLAEVLYENIPGGARWRYVWGSTLVFTFVTQVITGMFLWMAYSPSSQTAWESVYFIQFEMQGGWLLRAIHHYTAQAMVVLLPLHLLQVVVDKAYRAPRELNFWLGLILMLLVLGLALTGYLLPWDQKGYWATKVATNLMALAPFGESLQKLVVGGDEYGHHTLTRFFALHAGLLPALLVAVLAMHIALFRRHGITAKTPFKGTDQYFWPHQILKDGIAGMGVMLLVLLLAVHFDVVGALTGDLPVEHRGAELTAPADPSEDYSAARPEWYFLFLFQLLKYFESEFVGAIVVPGAILALLFAMPIIGRWKIGHALNVGLLVVLFVGAGVLTGLALHQDYYTNFAGWFNYDTEQNAKQVEHSEAYLAAKQGAEEDFERITELIQYYGIPKGGAIELQRTDPETQGPRLFRRHCASCHSHVGDDGERIAASEQSAPDLYKFASRDWIGGFLDPKKIAGHEYFGSTAHSEGEMVTFVQDEFSALTAEEQQQIIAALSAEAELVYQGLEDAQAGDDGTLEAGRQLVVDYCTGCHKFRDDGDVGYGPDLTGYGSLEWLRAFIANPAHERFYGDSNDRMPAFAEEPGAKTNLLTMEDVDLLARWLRADARYLIPRDQPEAALAEDPHE